LQPFVDPLPIPPLARAAGTRPDPQKGGEEIPYFRVAIRETRMKVHRDLPPTRMWTPGGSFPGPTIVTVSGKALLVDWENRRSISCQSITASTERKKMFPRCGLLCTFTGGALRQIAMATLRIGLSPAKRKLAITRAGRRLRIFSIMTTPWVLTG
jgi:hypothetical protein